MFSWFKNFRRNRILRKPLPESWLDAIRRNVAAFRKLDEDQREKLIECVKVIVAERPFEGCDGFQIVDEAKVIIAGQAALMLLGIENYYFDSVSAILVFPDVIQREPESDGIEFRAGEAYQSGQIVLSWPDVRAGAMRQDGYNVVIHEFAHHLDSLDGEMGGYIPFDNARDRELWERVSSREFEALVQAKASRQPVLLRYYGAQNRAEFFAVASEAFFEKPRRFAREHSELYDLLCRFYKIDPRTWRGEAAYH